MFNFNNNSKIYLAVQPVDMRKHFDSLWAVALNLLKEDPAQGAFFVFSNKQHSRCKVLFWDGTGVCLFAKRLEKGTFAWPPTTDKTKVELQPAALVMLLNGIDMKEACSRPWFQRN
jgi:transposase